MSYLISSTMDVLCLFEEANKRNARGYIFSRDERSYLLLRNEDISCEIFSNINSSFSPKIEKLENDIPKISNLIIVDKINDDFSYINIDEIDSYGNISGWIKNPNAEDLTIYINIDGKYRLSTNINAFRKESLFFSPERAGLCGFKVRLPLKFLEGNDLKIEVSVTDSQDVVIKNIKTPYVAKLDPQWPERNPLKPLAFLTMARDEEIMLRAWVENGKRICRDAAFYIIDHASSPAINSGLLDIYRDSGVDISVISYPDAPFDDVFKSQALSSLSQMLLYGFKTVIASDCDEIIVSPTLSDNEILDYIHGVGGIICPFGIEIVHHSTFEEKFLYNVPVMEQRKYGFFSAAYCKPIIWNTYANFSPGLHSVNTPFVYDENLFLLHLRSVDRELAEQRAMLRYGVSFSPSQSEKRRGGNWQEGGTLRFFDDLEAMTEIPNAKNCMDLFMSRVRGSYQKKRHGIWGHKAKIASPLCDLSDVFIVRNSDGAP